jgi:hypothetical protein
VRAELRQLAKEERQRQQKALQVRQLHGSSKLGDVLVRLAAGRKRRTMCG